MDHSGEFVCCILQVMDPFWDLAWLVAMAMVMVAALVGQWSCSAPMGAAVLSPSLWSLQPSISSVRWQATLLEEGMGMVLVRMPWQCFVMGILPDVI